MPRKDYSKEYAKLYNSLPAGAQRKLLSRDLLPLLNEIHPSKSSKILSRAHRTQLFYSSIPTLDLRAKKNEVNGLLDELQRDHKNAYFRDRSEREELLFEVVQSVSGWLGDVWSVGYEFGVQFEETIGCLTFALGVLDHVQTVRGLCKCIFSKLYVPIIIKKRSGEVVKSFTASGLDNIESAILWILRDLFVSFLASNDGRHKERIPDMLSEIDDICGWQGLEKMICGGKSYCGNDEEDECGEHGSTNHGKEDISHWLEDPEFDEYQDDEDEDDDDEEEEEEEEFFEANHWSKKKMNQCTPFRRLVNARLVETFRATPSFALYTTLLNLSVDYLETKAELSTVLDSIARTSGTTVAAAIEIYSLNNEPKAMADLLDTHSHLLRPRDARELQLAAKVFEVYPIYRARSVRIIEKELRDTAQCIEASVKDIFPRTDTAEQRTELAAISKLKRGTTAREERVDRWVDAAMAPGANSAGPDPIALAAMMGAMGMVGMGAGQQHMAAAATMGMAMDPDDADPLGMLDMNPNDPELADVKEELRPAYKERWKGWIDTADVTSGGVHTQVRVFKYLLETMPYLRMTDVVEEIIERLVDKPSKHHICAGLNALAVFVKTQTKKCAAERKKAAKQAAGSSSVTPALSTSPAGPSSSTKSSSSVTPVPSSSTTTPLASSDTASSLLASLYNHTIIVDLPTEMPGGVDHAPLMIPVEDLD